MRRKLRLGDDTLRQGRLDSLDCYSSDSESEAGDSPEVIRVTMLENIRKGNYRRDIYCVTALIVLVLSIAFSGRSVKVMRARTANSDAGSSHSGPSKSGGNNKFDSRRLEQSDYMKLINNAKEYQRLWGPWKEFGNETYSYWTQQVGESYIAYMNGKNFSTAQRQSVEFAACQTGKPQSRYFHASVAIELSPKGNVVRRKTKNVILVHGGSDGFIRNDSWVFVNGLIDSSKVPYTANVSRDTYNPIDGTSCNDCPMPIDGSGQKPCNQQHQTLHCNTCNRWHKLKLSKRSRSSLDCNIFGTWCPRHDPKKHWAYLKTLGTQLHRQQHKLVTIHGTTATNDKDGTVFTFGGRNEDTGRTRQLWYLSKLPYPRNGLLTSTSYKSDLTAEWYCAKVYGNAENASSYHDSIYRNKNLACALNSSKVIKSTNGIIDSGVLEPQSRCKWVIDYPDSYTNTTEMHVINFEFSRLDLTDSTATSCRNMVSIYNIPHNGSDKSILFRGCQYDNIKSNSFFSTPGGKLEIVLKYDNICPAHSGIAGYHRVVSVNTKCLRTCETILPCVRTCSGNGKCLYGFCSCFVGYTGRHCEKKCNLHETCKISEDPAPFFPSARSGHSMVSTYRKTTSIVHFYESSGTYPANCSTMSVSNEKVLNINASELDDRYGFVTNVVNKTVYKFTDEAGLSSRVITKTDVYAVTEGLTRIVVFGGIGNDGRAMNEIWTMDVQDQLLDDDTISYSACPEISGCNNFDLSACNTNVTVRHPAFPVLSRWNKWTKQSAIGVDLNGNSIARRYGHSAILVGEMTFDDDRPITESNAKQNMYIFGGAGVDSLLNDVWVLHIPINVVEGNLWNWKKLTVDRQTTGKVKLSGDLLEIQSHYPVSVNIDDTFSIDNCTNVFMNGEWKVIEVKSKYIFYANFSLKKDGEILLAVSYRRENTVKDIFFPAVISFGVMPSARRYHAASVYKNQTNSVSYMIVYGGQSTTHILNDVWLLNLHNTSNGYKWRQLFVDGVKGSWVQPYGSSNFIGWGGIHMRVHTKATLPERYGHSMELVTSSIHNTSAYSLANLVYGGSGTRYMTNSMSEDNTGGHEGGKNADTIYLCPEIDMLCAHPVFKGQAVSNKQRLALISIGVPSLLLYFLC
eukprot:g12303.t1